MRKGAAESFTVTLSSAYGITSTFADVAYFKNAVGFMSMAFSDSMSLLILYHKIT